MAQLQEMADDLRHNPPDDKDNGHNALLQDLIDLLREAKDYEFHDFRNKQHATPKVVLRAKLQAMETRVIDGTYDNPASSWTEEDKKKAFAGLVQSLRKGKG